MRNLLQDSDRDRLVVPLAGPLAGHVELGGRRFRALAEAEGSAFFPAEANAQAAELLLLPGLREAHGTLGDALLDFVMAMADSQKPCRRAVAGGIELRRDDPGDVEVVTPFYRLSGDLRRGELRQEPRGFAPEARLRHDRLALRHTGNLVEFRIGRERACVDVENAIAEATVTRDGDRIVLRHVGTIRGRAGLFRPREVEAGTIELRYEARADSPVLRVTARFTAARRLTRLRVTTALDELDSDGFVAGAARLLEGKAWREMALPAEPSADVAGTVKWAVGTPVAHVALGRMGWPADAPVLHLRPHDPMRVMSVTAETRAGGAVHWLVLRHGPVTLEAGESLTVHEDRMIAPAGDPALVAETMVAGLAGLDLDPAPPSGAALGAVATALLFGALPDARRAAVAAFAARHAARIEASSPGIADLAAAATGADALRRAGLMEALQPRLVARLAALVDGGVASLGAQSLAVLAFARAATWPDGQAAATSLASALGAVTAEAGAGLRFAGAVVDPATDVPGIAWLARAAGAAVLAADAGAVLPAAILDHARGLHRVAVNLLRPMIRPRAGSLEMVVRGGVGTSLQALTTLALLAPDRLVFGVRHADAA